MSQSLNKHLKTIAPLGGASHKKVPGYFKRIAKIRWANYRRKAAKS